MDTEMISDIAWRQVVFGPGQRTDAPDAPRPPPWRDGPDAPRRRLDRAEPGEQPVCFQFALSFECLFLRTLSRAPYRTPVCVECLVGKQNKPVTVFEIGAFCGLLFGTVPRAV